MNQNQSLLDSEPYSTFIRDAIARGETNTWIARNFHVTFTIPTSERSVRRFRKRHELGVPNGKQPIVKLNGDKAEVTTPAKPYPHLDDPDAMLRERGLDPEEWTIQGATVNEWDGPQEGGSVITYHQAKLQLKRKSPVKILPARIDSWQPLRKIPWLPVGQVGEPELLVVVGDQQAPYHDRTLHRLFCMWLEENEPHKGISLGDKMDLPEISKYRLDPENTAPVQECIDSAGQIFRDYREASIGTSWQVLPGNHDERLRNVLLDKPTVRPLYSVKRAQWTPEEEESVLAVPFLLRLDELDMEYVDPKGPYDLAHIRVNKNLAVRHGWIARQGSGTSALATLDHLGYSVIVGHTHRQSIVYKTTHDIDGETTTLTAAEAGCMCKISKGSDLDERQWPAFSPAPDWQQGFSTVTIHPNGYFRIENATYVNKRLLWRNRCYSEEG